MRVLISGCGYVGSALGLLLAAEGHTVFGLRRNTAALPAGITPVRADLSETLPPDVLPRDLDAVVFAASPGGSSDEAYRTAYVEGPRRVLSALGGRDVGRLVLVSSTGVYGQREGEWVDEGSPTEPGGVSGRRLLEGEGQVLGGTTPGVVLRLGGIYGPGRNGMIERALRNPPPDDGPPQYTNRIHRDDCAGALRHLLLLPDPGPVYLGVDHEPADRRTVAEWLAAHLRRDPPENLASPRNGARDRPGRTNKRCSNERLLRSGYEFRYPTFREGFAALLEETARPD
ncbi:NAD-dependent epimerase/dehydratase family protein [Rubrobacter marinus]|uniref:NAD-dependent epimerase/dehydratase family protein n=1 Tax=Rubrobacter marinus TaxID=2653852 RepID=A0A6G8PSN7_9ACTN|nr:SDR family oxidoreductase [Rubrobacter marinus]QIN77374.1 NAD-dependent epimerase/dehydratase family protein [Rubrobacter marinus]